MVSLLGRLDRVQNAAELRRVSGTAQQVLRFAHDRARGDLYARLLRPGPAEHESTSIATLRSEWIMERFEFLKQAACAVCLLCMVPIATLAQTVDQLIPHRVKLESVDYLGKRAIKMVEDQSVPNGEAYAVLKSAEFHDGTIEVELAGRPAEGAAPGARGFIGIAFRLRDDRFEYIYLRPTNGRAEDQVRRNHSTQYSSFPDFDFARLRREAPEKYESYVDLEAGAWTRYRVAVQGTTARLFVHGATQPCLVVNDLKLGDSSGGVALWIGPGTEGYFRGLTIRQ
jgi:hypothetical protein